MPTNNMETLAKDIFANLIENKKFFKYSSSSANFYIKGYSQNFKMKKIETGISKFAPGVNLDDVVLFLDATIMGSGKNGFLATADTLYWDGGLLVGKGQLPLDSNLKFSIAHGLLNLNGKPWVSMPGFDINVFIDGMGSLLSGNTPAAAPSAATSDPASSENIAPSSAETSSAAPEPPVNASSEFEDFIQRIFVYAMEKKNMISTGLSYIQGSIYMKDFSFGKDFKMSKLQNAIATYANDIKSLDEIIVLYDKTRLGSGKEGFIITGTHMYWNFGSSCNGCFSWKEIPEFKVKFKDSLFVVHLNGQPWNLFGFEEHVFKDAMNIIAGAYRHFEKINTTYSFTATFSAKKSVKGPTPNEDFDSFVKLYEDMDEKKIVYTSVTEDEENEIAKYEVEFGSESYADAVYAKVKEAFGDSPSFTLSKLKKLNWDWKKEGIQSIPFNSSKWLCKKRLCNKEKFKELIDYNISREERRKEKDEELKKIAESSASYMAVNAQKFNYGEFTDARDGNVYRTVRIGNLEWMAENLRFNCEGSVPYNENPENDKCFGRQYTWASAMGLIDDCNDHFVSDSVTAKLHGGNYQGIAPAGWHIPSMAEIYDLLQYVKANNPEPDSNPFLAGLGDNATSKDPFGFAAMDEGYMWCTMEGMKKYAAKLDLTNQGNKGILPETKNDYLSVRCVRNLSGNILNEYVQKDNEMKQGVDDRIEEIKICLEEKDSLIKSLQEVSSEFSGVATKTWFFATVKMGNFVNSMFDVNKTSYDIRMQFEENMKDVRKVLKADRDYWTGDGSTSKSSSTTFSSTYSSPKNSEPPRSSSSRSSSSSETSASKPKPQKFLKIVGACIPQPRHLRVDIVDEKGCKYTKELSGGSELKVLGFGDRYVDYTSNGTKKHATLSGDTWMGMTMYW